MATSQPPFTVKKRQEQNQYYEEPLGESVMPLRMMLIPTGTFTMGSPEDELERSDEEGPPHEVTVPQFFMAKYPVTQEQWRAVAAMQQVNLKLDSDPSFFKGNDRRPVEQVSWSEAIEFCDRLTLRTKRQYRLPSEAEWEYACRAGTTTPFNFGETLSTDYANYNGADKDGVYGPGIRGEYRQETTPVDYFEGANSYGLCNMHGNVWEWCQDRWHGNYTAAPTDGSPWESGNSPLRILRGGSWSLTPRHCRASSRNINIVIRDDSIGFRVCCSTPRTL